MSFEITTAFVHQFRNNITMLSQQKGSRLAGAVTHESITGTHGFVEQIGSTETQTRTSRHGDSPLVSTPHERRRINLDSEEWGDLVDNQDKVRMLIDPTSQYAMNAGWAFGRTKDDKIIAAATGAALTGTDGTTSTSLPSSQKVAVGGEGLSVQKLIDTASIFGINDVDPDEQKYFVCSQKQLDDLLAIEKVTSADYSTVKALAHGKINSYMGFEFIRTQRLTLTVATDVRTCFAFVKSGLALGVGSDVVTRISERADKAYSTYVYAKMDVGAARLEEEKVVEVMCDESP
jgi:hypothetical protein